MTDATLNDRAPNFRGDDGRLYLVRCFACDPEHGRENWALSVATGLCAFCGYSDPATERVLSELHKAAS